MVWNNEGDPKGSLSRRLIPAGKGTTCIQCFKLCAGHNLGLTVNVGVGRAVKARHLIVQESSVFDCKYDIVAISGQLFSKDKSGRGCFETDAKLLRIDLSLVANRILRRNEAKLLCVKRDFIGSAVC